MTHAAGSLELCMSQRKEYIGYLFILPALAVILTFRFYPILQAIRMSFFKWGGAQIWFCANTVKGVALVKKIKTATIVSCFRFR